MDVNDLEERRPICPRCKRENAGVVLSVDENKYRCKYCKEIYNIDRSIEILEQLTEPEVEDLQIEIENFIELIDQDKETNRRKILLKIRDFLQKKYDFQAVYFRTKGELSFLQDRIEVKYHQAYERISQQKTYGSRNELKYKGQRDKTIAAKAYLLTNDEYLFELKKKTELEIKLGQLKIQIEILDIQVRVLLGLFEDKSTT